MRCDRHYSSRVTKLDCPECGGNLFLMARQKDTLSWRCCTRPTHVFVMTPDRTLVAAPMRAARTDEQRTRLAEELHHGCSGDTELLRRLGDL